MLNFTDGDGAIKKKSLYSYINRHKSDPEVVKILNMDGKSIIEKYRNYLVLAPAAPSANTECTSQEFDFESGTSSSSKVLNFSKPLTEDELLEQHGYDKTKWKITKHQCSKWNSGIATLMSSKIFVKPRNILENSPKQFAEIIQKALKIPDIQFNPKISKHGSKLLVIPISDLHYGLISESAVSGDEYNMQIAEKRLETYITTICDNVNLSKEDTILVTFGNDFFNCDNVQGTTAHGTPQDNECSYFTVWDKGVNLGVSTIDYLLKNTSANVYIASVQGNHDFQSSHAMLMALYMNYKQNSRVAVNVGSDKKSRFYYTFGENLIGFGHETKIKECHRIVSSECKDWSNFKYRTMFLGHLHKEEVLDTGALVVRRLPIFSGKSTWTDQQGFVSHPRAQAFVFSSEKGLINTLNVEID